MEQREMTRQGFHERKRQSEKNTLLGIYPSFLLDMDVPSVEDAIKRFRREVGGAPFRITERTYVIFRKS